MASLEKSLAINPRHFSARVALGNFSIKAGNPAEALKIASALGDEFPDNSASAILRGDAYLADKQWTKAEQAYADALRTVECAGTEAIPRDCLLRRCRQRQGNSTRLDA